MTGTYQIEFDFKRHFPDAMLKEGANNEKLGARPPVLKAELGPKVIQTIEFFEEDGVTKAVLTTKLGKQKVDKVVYDGHTISWSAYSGSEGMDLWYYSMAVNEVSTSVVGIASGQAPYFRGYVLFYGEQIAR